MTIDQLVQANAVWSLPLSKGSTWAMGVHSHEDRVVLHEGMGRVEFKRVRGHSIGTNSTFGVIFVIIADVIEDVAGQMAPASHVM